MNQSTFSITADQESSLLEVSWWDAEIDRKIKVGQRPSNFFIQLELCNKKFIQSKREKERVKNWESGAESLTERDRS